uniref:Uncharacterized protein n=1 Tax=Rhizophora mucronata TaxID=61149 RepID=A0A2P2P8M2_RHIMU
MLIKGIDNPRAIWVPWNHLRNCNSDSKLQPNNIIGIEQSSTNSIPIFHARNTT